MSVPGALGVEYRLVIGGKKDVLGVVASGMLIGVCAAVAVGVVVENGEKGALAGVLLGVNMKGRLDIGAAAVFEVALSDTKDSLAGLG